MTEKERRAEELVHEIFIILEEDYDFRFNVTTGEIEYYANDSHWKALNDNIISSICDTLTLETGNVFLPKQMAEYVKSAPSLRYEVALI